MKTTASEREVLHLLQGLLQENPDANLLDFAGSVAFSCNETGLAESCWQKALALDGRSPSRLKLAQLFEAQGREAEAVAAYRDCLTQQPENGEAAANLGLLLSRLGMRREAEKWLRNAVRRLPENALAHGNLANFLAEENPLEAESLYRKAIALDPENASFLSNFGVLLSDLSRTRDAEAFFRRALSISPQNAAAKLNLGFLLLSVARFPEGWEYHEARLELAGGQLPTFEFPRWKGEPLSGKSILILPEQGLGDEIMICRYAELLQKLGAKRVVLACRDPLYELFSSVPGAEVVRVREAEGIVCDYWVFSMSLPYLCGTTIESIPARVPYLYPDPARIEKWRPRLPQGFKVGLVWKGSGFHGNRSLPSFEPLLPLLSITGVSFVSLQVEADAPPEPVLHLGSEIGDFADTAAIVSLLDLVISVDTAAAHLCGALGVPCWLMLPEWKVDWRWLRRRADSPWYPKMRLFRRAGGWAGVVAEIRAALVYTFNERIRERCGAGSK